MPTNAVKELMARVKNLEDRLIEWENKLTVIHTDLVWVKRIIVGAAGLGFLEKALGWWIK